MTPEELLYHHPNDHDRFQVAKKMGILKFEPVAYMHRFDLRIPEFDEWTKTNMQGRYLFLGAPNMIAFENSDDAMLARLVYPHHFVL